MSTTTTSAAPTGTEQPQETVSAPVQTTTTTTVVTTTIEPAQAAAAAAEKKEEVQEVKKDSKDTTTKQLPPGTLVLNAFMLCIALGIKNAYNEKGKDEFLFYKGIPGSCVESSWDPWGYCPPQIGSHPPMRRGFLSSWVDIVKEAEIAQTIYQVQTSSTSWTTNSSFSASPAAAAAATAASARETLDGLMREEGRLRQELEELEERQQKSIVELNNLNNDADADADAVYDPNAVDVDDVCDLAGQMEKSPEPNTSDTIDDADVNNPTGADGQMKMLDAETNLDAQSRTIPEVDTAGNTVTTMTEATNTGGSAPAGDATGP
ncbi:hypothetical protein NEUTE1DRAFT_149041 [Neurospora tetrasperma FGSC 2508]|uniref:Uncharacterized protein n=1 Tax=Neurospora tetrasperma (strain FGSC 2508 / ATCC MYA-4615 / P0657) TaxID=510951 RepID=F8MVZ9_NEUT8|nr:uncharacterized protein NEUTE1DRAFT_149041 [Neurospora tetrasperma FGSC 2508]EGO54847.1 hypothetical protein NEUTE1DRAFT_149041 [Neurospora tetrasperma FGSC 2508]EGZ67664.1 hypothetical protein NEUTE2DRAFT_169521 [Neurospora tetrasperma FGSC 2509]